MRILLPLLLSATAILAVKIDDGLIVGQGPVPYYMVGQPGLKYHHIPFETESDLNLTPGQIKIFSGHVLNMVKAKCPDVGRKNIFQLQKYIGKFIAARMETTQRVGSIDAATKKEEFDSLIASLVSCTKEERKPKKVPVARTQIPIGPEPIDFSPGVQLDFQHVVNAPEEKKVEQKSAKRPESGSPFIMWVRSVLEDIKNFFANAFSRNGGRHRRDTATTEEPQKKLTDDQVKGKEAIMDVIDQICRIYCSECGDMDHMRTFRMAIKEFMQFAFADENILQVASHQIADSFIQSLRQCDRGQLEVIPEEKK